VSIKLQFVCEAALSSQIIAWFSSGYFSHVDAVLHNGYLLGARNDWTGKGAAVVPPGVRIRPPGYRKFSRRVVMDVPATSVQTKNFYDYLMMQLGKPYDHRAILGFLFNRDWREDDSWICSELQTAAGEYTGPELQVASMTAAGILPRLYLPANKITPVACAVAFSAVGGKATECTP